MASMQPALPQPPRLNVQQVFNQLFNINTSPGEVFNMLNT